MKKVFLEDLPTKEGIGKLKGQQVIDWFNSINYKIRFIYNDIKGELEIVNYDGKYLYIKYLDEPIFKILTNNFHKCRLGKLLNKITNEFKIDIGTCFKDDNRDIIITNKQYRPKFKKDGSLHQNYKYYKYKCNKCGYDEGWIVEGSLQKGVGCSCCSGKAVVQGINDIPTTAPWMVKFFQGGYEEAKTYTKSSKNKIYPICPDCGRAKSKATDIGSIYRYHSIGCSCGDGFSYSEKVMYSTLEQLNISFITQLSKTTFKWCDNYKYDFYIPSLNCIIETHGKQHYTKKFNFKGSKSILEEQENDKIKEELALKNGIDKYIIIDCRESNLEYIKNNILHSKLVKLFNLSNIDWDKCEEFALNNLVKVVCSIKKNNPHLSVSKISEVANISMSAVSVYLKRGSKLGWCDYNPKKETKRTLEIGRLLKRKPVICIDTNEIFDSITQASEKYNTTHIGECCQSKRKSAGKHPTTGEPLKWMYYEDYLKIHNKNNNNNNIELIHNEAV